MSSRDFCSDISVIPQFSGMCWFNAIMMSSFFSQRMRKLMIDKISKTWGNGSLFKFFKTILKYNYKSDDPRILTLFNKIKPEMVLLKTLYKLDRGLYELLKKEHLFGWQIEYVNLFLKYLNVKTLDIVYLNETNRILFNIAKNKTYTYSNEKKSVFLKPEIDIIDEEFDIRNAIRNIPDVLILTHTELYNDFRYNKNYTRILEKNANYSIYNAENYGINEEAKRDISNYNDEINLFGHKYKLDSVLLNNYNKLDIGHHSIVGIHCNNNRYVYNGWNRTVEKTPCSLIKFNWNLRNNQEFCLNTDKCKLDPIDARKLCFSFNKGTRILVYVKVDEAKKTSLINSSLTSRLSNINDIIENFYNLPEMSDENIREILDDFNIKYRKGDNLRKLLNDKFAEFYGFDNSKLILINKIKKLHPELPNLESKSTQELEEIYQILLRLSTMDNEEKKRKRSSNS